MCIIFFTKNWINLFFKDLLSSWDLQKSSYSHLGGSELSALGITDMENKKSITILHLWPRFCLSPVLQRCIAVIQLHLLMAVFPVWMVQLSPTPLCIHVWRDICSQAHPRATVWPMVHGLARLQTAQVSSEHTDTRTYSILNYVSCSFAKVKKHFCSSHNVMKWKKSNELSSHCQRQQGNNQRLTSKMWSAEMQLYQCCRETQ